MKKTNSVLAISAGLLLIASPYFTLAETKAELKVSDNLEYRLVAVDIGLDALVPAKIAKAESRSLVSRFLNEGKGSRNGTTTNDTIPPLVFGIRTDAGTSTAAVTWFTNERASSLVRYGTTSALEKSSSASEQNFRHKAVLGDLAPDTLYHYVIAATDAAGNTRETAPASFRTDPVPLPKDTAPPRMVLNIATSVTRDSAKIIWVTNEETRGRLFLSASTPVNGAPLLERSELSFFHEARIEGLRASTDYFYTIETIDAAGNTSREENGTFTTRPD